MKVICVIPARKGSKRLVGKNKRLFYGKPLFVWSLEQALQCDFIDEIIVSTDDEDIINICKKLKNERVTISKRPKELAQDNTSTYEVIKYELSNYLDNTIVIILQPTNPLREYIDIEKSFNLFIIHNQISIISVFREDVYHFKLNGCIYIFKLKDLRETNDISQKENLIIYIMQKDKSIDIDTLEDWNLAEKLMKDRGSLNEKM